MTAQRIRILDDLTINQIAAGEVIENPASAIKELVENALDAGATEINIVTQSAGRGLIRVSDNGCGMGPEDLVLSLERHATSKISTAQELESLETLGFRGEALPSIAAVSKMKLHSSWRDGEGNLIEVAGGRLGNMQPLPRQRGTTIEVRSLFFNTPVRKKFQRTLSYDLGEIYKIVAKFAIGYSSLMIAWENDGVEQLRISPFLTPHGRMEPLLGEEFIQQALPVEHEVKESNAFRLSGYLSSPSLHRPNRIGQHLFINQRAVQSAWVSQIVLESYATRLPSHRYPLFVLHLSLPSAWLDLNVHPQKKEVRIREEGRVAQLIREGVGNALAQREMTYITAQPPSFPQPEEVSLKVAEPIAPYQVSPPRGSPAEMKPLLPRSGAPIIGRIEHFLLVQEMEGILVIDRDLAFERIVYEQLQPHSQKRSVQTLLFPLHLNFSPKESTLLENYLEALNQIGIAIRPFGRHSYIVDAIPSILETHEIVDLLDAYLTEGGVPKKIGQCLKRGNARELGHALVEQLFACENPDYTPDGKRIYARLDEHTLANLLGNKNRPLA